VQFISFSLLMPSDIVALSFDIGDYFSSSFLSFLSFHYLFSLIFSSYYFHFRHYYHFLIHIC